MSAKILALSIGIGSYAELPILTCPPNDAKDFAMVVHSGLTPSEVRLLTNADATKESIFQGLAWLADASRATDIAILFFSGHGCRLRKQTFLCPVDAQTKDLEKTCLTSRELTERLHTIKADRLVVLLDTCHSGGIEVEAGVTESTVSAMVGGNARFILAATRPDVPALESSTMRNGIFTTHLLEALRGKVADADGRVWASDVFSFVAH